MNFLLIIVSIAPVIIGFLLARFFVPVSIFLHELGHFVAAKSLRIPVYAFKLGSGKSLLNINFIGIPWSFNREVSEGEIVVPRLVPVSSKGWNSIVLLALAGPAVNLLLMLCAGSAVILFAQPVMKAIAVAAFFANYSLVRSADGDYELAKTARSKNLEKLTSYHKVGDDAPPLFNLG
jgi:membrane-associated protease RseP (regulator of RpoE activity)